MTFCYSPWTNIDISPTGQITPCCKFQVAKYDEKFNLQNNSIAEYRNSNFLKEIKHTFTQGQWPKGCDRCRIEEENGIESKRILDYTRWKENYNQYNLQNNEILTASIAFGNTCNLTCITCGAHSSSRWQKEYQQIYNIDIPHFKFYKENFVKDFVKLAPKLVHVDIPGGEPFLSGVEEQQELLRYYISIGKASDISLHYTTNATIYPDDSWCELWQHFKEVDIQLSIDGINKRYEYIRYPANWETLVNHTQRYIAQEKVFSVLRLSVSHTVSAYNIFYLDEFVQWCYNMNLPRPWLGRVHSPDHMRPSVWPNNVRKIISDHLLNSTNEDVKLWAQLLTNTDDSKVFDLFKIKLYEHDSYRKLNFAQTFPELAEYI